MQGVQTPALLVYTNSVGWHEVAFVEGTKEGNCAQILESFIARTKWLASGPFRKSS